MIEMYLIDSNVFLHILLKTEESERAASFLDENKGSVTTTLLNMMEIASVLSRKYRWKGRDIKDVLREMRKNLPLSSPDEYDILEAYDINEQEFLTPIDAIMVAVTSRNHFVLITYDKELISLDGKFCAVKSI
jgi:predicted nucleic acid-binding protein